MPTTYDGIIIKQTPEGAAKVKKDPPVTPPRVYPITPPGGPWTNNERVTFELEKVSGKETAFKLAKRS